MKNVENNNYIINEDYHGDVKVIKNNSKKVDLSKPTDTLEHKSKQQEMMPTIYNNSNPPSVANKFDNKVCLTKPKDSITKEEKSQRAENLFNQILEEEQNNQQSYNEGNNTKVRLFFIFMMAIFFLVKVSHITYDGFQLTNILQLIGIFFMIFLALKLK